MLFVGKIFGPFVVFSLFFELNTVFGDTDISSIVADDQFVSDDICYSMTNEQPCVNKLLRQMREILDLVNKNSHQIIEIRSSLEKTEKTNKLLTLNLENREQNIKGLDKKIQDISKENIRLKREVQKLELNGHLYSVPVKKSNKSDGFNETYIDNKIDSRKLVRY